MDNTKLVEIMDQQLNIVKKLLNKDITRFYGLLMEWFKKLEHRTSSFIGLIKMVKRNLLLHILTEQFYQVQLEIQYWN